MLSIINAHHICSFESISFLSGHGSLILLKLKLIVRRTLIVRFFLGEVLTLARILVDRALAATLFRLLGASPLPILIHTHLPRLLDRILHHLLLLETLTNVVAIEAQIALLAEAQQNLRAEAAPYH